MKPFYENKDCMVQAFESVNLEFPEHLHDHVEILYVMEGSIAVQIMEKRQELQKGDCAVIFPQQIHSYQASGGNRARLYIFKDSLVGMYLHSFRKCVPSCPFLSAEELAGDGALALDRLYELLHADGEQQGMKDGADKLCSAWIQVLLAWTWPCLAPVRQEQSESTELTCLLVQYITEHFQEPLTLELLARELHVNKYYISNIFSGRLGTNFRRYLNHVRLEYAMQLMKASDAPLIDVWAEAGFNSQRSFNRAFMEIMGMTPVQYRKK